MRHVHLGVAACMLVLVVSTCVHAQWKKDGLEISAWGSAPGIVTDGVGGAIIVWRESSTADIYAQHVNSFGRKIWSDAGVAICSASGSQSWPQIAPDASGGAIIAWVDERSGSYELYAQRISSAGNTLWQQNGVAICSGSDISGSSLHRNLIADGKGGAIIAWIDHRNGNWDIYAQRISGTGNTLWASNGVAVCSATDNEYWPELVADGEGGAIISWTQECIPSAIVCQRIASYGVKLWEGNGIVLSSGNATSEGMVSDGAGGAIVLFTKYGAGGLDIYAQKISPGGVPLWVTGGISVCDAEGWQTNPEITEDEGGGAIIAWEDHSGETIVIYANKLGASGLREWGLSGIQACDQVNLTQECGMCIESDGAGGCIIVWADNRRGPTDLIWTEYTDIYSQRVTSEGSLAWEDNGSPVCERQDWDAEPMIASDCAGGALIAWKNGAYPVLAGRMDRYGYWGYPAPFIVEAIDISNDQGGAVDLAWQASRLDPWPEESISRYSIWRAINHSEYTDFQESGNTQLLEGLKDLPMKIGGTILREEHIGSQTFYWYLMTTISAYHLPSYSCPTPTLFDSTGASFEYHYFQVIAHGNDPAMYWLSAPDSGYSKDNLAPQAPSGLAGEQMYLPAGLKLTWDPNTDIDFMDYAIYRGSNSEFVPGPHNRIAVLCEPFYFDQDWRWNNNYCYKISATDIHGNESGFSYILPMDVTGTDDKIMVPKTALKQNFPNPFNPYTRIDFSLKAGERISLGIYDSAGKLVRTLINEYREAGSYHVTWDGKDNLGRDVGSGVYFCEMRTNGFGKSNKMVLLR